MNPPPPQVDDDDSLTRLERELDRSIAQLAHRTSQISLASSMFDVRANVPNEPSDLSSDDEKYETFSLGPGRRESDVASFSGERSDDEKRIYGRNNSSSAWPDAWWRFQPQSAAGGDGRSSGAAVDGTNDSVSSSSDERDPKPRHSFSADTKQKSEASTQSTEKLPWWQNPFRRHTTPGDRPDVRRRQSTSSLELSQDQLRVIQSNTNTLSKNQNNAVPSSNPNSSEEDAELNQLLFPRRGNIQNCKVTRRASSSSNGSDPSHKGSIRSHRSKQSSLPVSINSIDSHDREKVNQVVRRNSINLGSIERALLADLVSSNESRWKVNKHSVKNSSLASVERYQSTTIPEEADSMSFDKSYRDNPTAETQMETLTSPHSQERLLDSDPNDDSNADGDSLSSSGQADSDGVYCSGWSVVGHKGSQEISTLAESIDALPPNESEYGAWVGDKDPKTMAPTTDPTDNLAPVDSDYGLWDTEAMLALNNGVALSRTNAIDEVSSLASSNHSGRIINAKHNRSLTHRRKNGQSLFSSQFSNWRGGNGKLSSSSARGSSISREDDEEEDYDLEGQVFAVSDEKHKDVVKEAMELMESVNKSMVSMGMEAPFRPIEEICPPFKKLHKNLLRQFKELKAVSSSDYDKWLHNTKKYKPKGRAPGLTVSLNSETSDITGTSASEAPSLDDRKAVAAYIMNRITAHETGSISRSPTESKVHTAFLPNFMYYQFVAADPTSVIKPTSLCSGTGITGSDQYLQRDMLELFGMFGSYFVGAGHLFQEEEEDAEDKPRRTPFYMEPIHEGESVGGESDASGLAVSDDSEDDKRSEGAEAPDAHLSLELLESIIDELKRGQTQEMPDIVMSNEGPTIIIDTNATRGTSKVMENYEIRDRSNTSIIQ